MWGDQVVSKVVEQVSAGPLFQREMCWWKILRTTSVVVGWSWISNECGMNAPCKKKKSTAQSKEKNLQWKWMDLEDEKFHRCVCRDADYVGHLRASGQTR